MTRANFPSRWRTTVCLLFLLGLVAAPGHAETRNYGYDSFGRLTSVKYGDGTTVVYVYDAAGNRVMQSVTPSSAPADNPPKAPGHPGIADGASGVSLTPTLAWAPTTDPDTGDQVAYSVYLGTSTNPPLVWTGWATNWHSGVLHGLTTYYWHVAACDSHDNCVQSPLWSFTTTAAPPTADFLAVQTNGWAPLSVKFYQRATSADDTVVAWDWDFDQSGTSESSKANPTYVYNRAGNYSVTLKATDSHGTSGSVTKTAYIHVLDQTIIDLAPLSLRLDGTTPYRHVGVIYSVTNFGTVAINALCEWDDCFYVSTNSVFDDSATQVTCFHENNYLLPGAHYARTNLVTVPAGVDSHYYLFLQVDGLGLIPEIDEDNNVVSVPLTLPAPNLRPAQIVPPAKIFSGQPTTLAWRVTNLGSAAALGPWYDEVFISTNSVRDGMETSLGTFEYETNLAASASYWMTNSVTLPRLAPGTYYFIVAADSGDYVFETEEGDNALAQAVSVVLGPQPDLMPTLALATPTPLVSGQTATLVWCVTNQGTAQPLGSWEDQVWLSTKPDWDYDYLVAFLGEANQELTLPSHTSYWTTNQVTMPRVAAGDYYLLVFTDAQDDLFEANENNNILSTSVSVSLGRQPDLAPVSVAMPAQLPSGRSVQLVMTVTNQGAGPASGSWYDALFLSTNSSFDVDSCTFLAITSDVTNVAAGSSYQVTNLVQLPRLTPGNYYLYAVADFADQVFESNEGNNTLQLPVKVVLGAMPDLVPLPVQVAATLTKGEITNFVWGITNQGPGTAQGPWEDVVYFSSNSFPDSTSMAIAMNLWETNMDPRGSYWITNDFVCPSVPPGTYYLIVSADVLDQVYESAEDNNTLAVPIVVTVATNEPDLSPISLSAPAYLATAGQTIQVTYVVTNLTTSAADGFWVDFLALSTNTVIGDSAIILAQQYIFTPVSGHGGYTQTASFQLPASALGNYYLILVINMMNLLLETDSGNNTLIRALQIGGTPAAPDLSPVSLRAPSAVLPGQAFQVSAVITNQGNGSASGSWVDQVAISSNSVWDAKAVVLANHPQSQPLAAAASYTFTDTISLPAWTSGGYYLMVKANATGTLAESTSTNNTLAVPIDLLSIRFLGAARLANGTVELSLQGLSAGSTYSLLASTNLVNWTSVLTFAATNSDATSVVDPNAASFTSRFYRVTQ